MLKYNSEEQFTVERGYLNRTKIYLYPSIVLLKSYHTMRLLKDNFLCCAFADNGLILFYDRMNIVGLRDLIQKLKQNNEYIDDRLYSEDVYMIKIKPDINLDAFIEGRYSDIYTSEQINLVFTRDSITRKVLTREESYKQTYVDMLNSWFNTSNTIDYIEIQANGKRVPISQFDIPPCLNQELIDYERPTKIKGGIIKQAEYN